MGEEMVASPRSNTLARLTAQDPCAWTANKVHGRMSQLILAVSLSESI